jgi:hypothetical protein
VPDHPDPEQLAALQAGDGDRRQRAQVAGHVASCPSCAEVVAAVEQARTRLALLGEPELPAGLHERVAAAVGAEAKRAVLPARRPAWYRRPAAWGAAAAAILLAALVVPLLTRPDSLTTASGGRAGGGAAEEAPMYGGADTGAAAAGLPVLRLDGEVTAARVRSALAGDPTAMQAYRRATASAAEERDLKGQTTTEGRQATPSPAAPSAPGAAPSTTAPQPCLAAATARAGRPLQAAFLVEGTYQGRPATVLVTAVTGDPGRVDMWVFPQGDCSGAPLATERLG